MTKVFICGPMTGLPDFNYPSFHEAGEYLEEHGFEIRSGAHRVNAFKETIPVDPPSTEETEPHEHYMRRSIYQLIQCDLIYLLDGWADSKGARLEVKIAKSIGLKTLELQPLK